MSDAGGSFRTGTYRVDGSTIVVAWEEEGEPIEMTYEVGATLSIERQDIGSASRFVPDDS